MDPVRKRILRDFLRSHYETEARGEEVRTLFEQYQAAMEASNELDFKEDIEILLGDIPGAIKLRMSTDARE